MARRFRFRLETVQRLRQRARDVQRRVVAARRRDVSGVQEQIAGLEQRAQGTVVGARAAQQAASFDVAAVRTQNLHRGWLRHKISEAGRDLVHVRKDLEIEQGKLVDAAAKLKVIEKLRERQWERHRLEVAREERSLADEVAVQMYLRRQRAFRDEVSR